MDESTALNPQSVEIGMDIIKDIRRTATDMSGWLKFLGVTNIILGALTAISIVGIVIAWIPIWIGVLLFQAGSRATDAQITEKNQELVVMMGKLKTYFIINAILIIVGLALMIITFFAVGLGLIPLLNSFSDFQ